MTQVAAEASTRRVNKRGAATRESMIKTAIAALATGDPAAVSGNRIARDVGATWGAIKYQFGDIDGLWAAVLQYLADDRGVVPTASPIGSLHQRVTALIDMIYDGLRTPESLAIENLRAALPRDNAEFERTFPLTAAEFASWKPRWEQACEHVFIDLDINSQRIREMAALIPAAMRGITSERTLGSYGNLEAARVGLINSIAAYLEQDLDRR